MEFKWSCPGHIARRGDDRCSETITEWRPRCGLGARWPDDIVKAETGKLSKLPEIFYLSYFFDE